MNPFFKKSAELIAAQVAAEGIAGIKELGGSLIGNYAKRRNVGFGPAKSLAGSFHETSHYYGDLFNGKEPTVMKQAIYFDDKM